MSVRELNVVVKDWRRTSARCVLAYPSYYRVSVSSLITHIVYFMVNSVEEFLCERAYLDARDESGRIVTLESGRPLKDFDVILFSVHYELDYKNVAAMLINSGIEPLRERRSPDDPLIVVGGPSVTANPEPLADIADVVMIGEVEGTLPVLLEAIAEYGAERALEELVGRRGIYVTTCVDRVRRYWLPAGEFSRGYAPTLHILPLDKKYQPIYGRSFLVEVTRGCGYWCRFCLLGHTFLPPRHRDVGYLKQVIERGLKVNDLNKVTLISSTLLSNPGALDLIEWIVSDLEAEVSAPSMRVDELDKDVLELLVRGGQRTITIAPEAGSERLRRILGKGFTNDEVVEVAEMASKVGMRNVKMYFIIGTPWETREDLMAIIDLVKRVREAGFKLKDSIRVSINPLIPKAQTPMQWLPLWELNELRRKLQFLTSELRSPQVRVETYDPRLAFIQAVLSLGDRRLSKLIDLWARAGEGLLGPWRRAVKLLGLNVHDLVARRGLEDSLPWDHIDVGVKREFLVKEYEDMLKGVVYEPCPRQCKLCGVCMEVGDR